MAIFFILFKTKSALAQEPTFVKLSNFNQFIRIFANCACGEAKFNDSTKVTYKKLPGYIKDTIVLKINDSDKEIKYLIEPPLLSTKIQGVEVDIHGNSKIRTRSIKYYLANKIE